MEKLILKQIRNYSELTINDSFKVTKKGLNNSDCSWFHGGSHGTIKDYSIDEIYKVKNIYSGGIYSTKEFPFTIETYCNCFIRMSIKYILKIS